MFSPSIQMTTAMSANRKPSHIISSKNEKEQNFSKNSCIKSKEDYEDFLRAASYLWKKK